ncbi:hypothetical protein [Parvularcula maris]|uniref:Uncharacterized protein n=1 Tax=Parvularcula maris TaxID=2965077 RepID=A0A9X2L797_9PROT|nr:hypothetical protein [Parvularcula maris]MCQ8184388.1 hypothetical protein [Parvularcula maris]
MRKLIGVGVLLSSAALVAAALFHVALIFGDPSWVAFAGAPLWVTESFRDGTWQGPVVTSAIALILLVFAAYGWSATGRPPKLPLTRLALGLIAALFLLRASALVHQLPAADFSKPFDQFHVAASVIIGLTGLSYGLGALFLRRR